MVRLTWFRHVLPGEVNHTFVISKMSYFSSTAYKGGLRGSFRRSSSFHQEDPATLNYYFDTVSTICLHTQENTKIITERARDFSSSHGRQVYWTDFIQLEIADIPFNMSFEQGICPSFGGDRVNCLPSSWYSVMSWVQYEKNVDNTQMFSVVAK